MNTNTHLADICPTDPVLKITQNKYFLEFYRGGALTILPNFLGFLQHNLDCIHTKNLPLS